MNQTELAARDYRILTAFAAGRTLKEIALAEHVHPNTIRRTLRRYGVNPSPQVRSVDAAVVARLADRDWLAAEYATKNTLQIAAELGCPESRVRRALIRADIPRHRPHESPGAARGWRAWAADVQERAVARYCDGQSAPAVAKELGVSVGGVYALLHERGVVRTMSEAQRLVGRRR